MRLLWVMRKRVSDLHTWALSISSLLGHSSFMMVTSVVDPYLSDMWNKASSRGLDAAAEEVWVWLPVHDVCQNQPNWKFPSPFRYQRWGIIYYFIVKHLFFIPDNDTCHVFCWWSESDVWTVRGCGSCWRSERWTLHCNNQTAGRWEMVPLWWYKGLIGKTDHLVRCWQIHILTVVQWWFIMLCLFIIFHLKMHYQPFQVDNFKT